MSAEIYQLTNGYSCIIKRDMSTPQKRYFAFCREMNWFSGVALTPMQAIEELIRKLNTRHLTFMERVSNAYRYK